ncbi:bile acid:sodium symporter family protein [Paraburkholderia caballeronis]|uniref:Solute carrier family 10 (Sodium/bile acid cotransporter), member 7 n=1 Tax=Paraburkholderia caballeronis TaxID=416943 RepID=A0A1H7HPA3_9BURK|nr:bile acid:sodium symporter family protein [Paraburkholderia caballeronis]PXW29448.1 sodium/bile acid cotransporter 7 [Paraburkholderia caballeronis]PXX04707.1 sodium/bile acid cotransporter 7 [Paraburkholderia caballeronis]RAK05768.1 sodium/bile acid cotransporter 7 [Paraburkholderia caballeronis]TDV18547.1 sodium/bile acid cotransporter 7 [Paraburkholderia caballeronis]TDV19915.1 sodium/bile acid cotransporter 7 [Paraburkholderia caballeronis]
MARPKLLPDNFTLCLVGTVILASLLPVHGQAAVAFNWLTNIAVGLLFFLHGAKLSREAIIAGATHWRLHLVVLASTFVLFPVLGLALKPVLSPLVTPALYMGVLFLCTLPSTVQSSIAFTSIARGNVPAAVCSASASSLLGIFITPALVSLIVTTQAAGSGSAWHTIWNIVLQLLVPFVAGQLLRPLIGRWIERNRGVLKFVDQGSILLVVYGAFSEAVNEGLWHHIPLAALGGLVVVNAVLLAIALGITIFVSKRLGFSRADQITIIFCGSKKSLASGVPMAKVIFASNAVGAVVLPLMLFHQIQLMVCAALAQRWGARDTSAERAAEAGDESRATSAERQQTAAARR